MKQENFRRYFWLFSRHLETMGAAFSKSPAVHYQRKTVQSFDGEKIALDFSAGDPQKPLLTVFHGLEGCSQSRTVRQITVGFIRRGWSVAVPHFRSCGGYINHNLRAYHAADTAEVDWMLHYCADAFPHSMAYAAGVSLGGNMLINRLAEDNPPPLAAAAAISAPFDLNISVRMIDAGPNRLLYARHFLKTLRAKVMKKSLRYPNVCDWEKIRRVKTLADFDELYTAPIHGFKSAEEYWRCGSCSHSINRIKTPLICINALNDPMVPVSTLPKTAVPPVVFCRPRHGGHGSFIGRPREWLSDTLANFFLNRNEI